MDPPPKFLDYRPTTVIIIPVRGVPAHLNDFWRGICSQKFGPFRIAFAVESVSDTAYAALQALTGGPEKEIVVAGSAVDRGQKVHNQLAALRTLRPSNSVVVLADADIVPGENWLVGLVTPLFDPEIEVVSGYRWMAPVDERWSTAFVCVANASIASLLRLRPLNLAWGGSTALRRRTLDELALESCWKRAVLDDLPLTRAVHRRGYRVYGPRDVLVLTPVSYSWKEAIAFGRRQYLFVRMHAPSRWLLAAGATTVPLIGWATAIPLALRGDMLALAVLIAANILDHFRAHLRRRVSAKLFGADLPIRMARLDRWGTPAYLAFHSAIIWSTLLGRTINWAGRVYRLDKNNRVVTVTSL